MGNPIAGRTSLPLTGPERPTAEPRAGARAPWKTAFLPLPILLALVATWLAIHVDTRIGLGAAIATGLGAAGTLSKSLWTMINARYAAAILSTIQRVLESPRTAVTTWALVVLFMVSSAFITTVHIDVDERAANAVLSRIDQHDVNSAAVVAETLTVHAGDHLISPLMIWPKGRTVWLTSATGLQSDPRHVVPWFRTSFKYTAHFDTLISVTLLPLGADVIHALSQDTVGLRLVVFRDTAVRDTVAKLRVTSTRGLLLAFGQPTVPDSAATRSRWAALAMGRLGLDADGAGAAAREWWPPQLVSAIRILRSRDRLRYSLVDQGGVTVRTDTFTLRGPSTDAILSQRP